ncbi:hypothetical protein CEXT_755521 [Caerostris extrusa]|uniref:Uncharacterized protein n=1 Tax=Caerostris extrusa TaxID=172846 RepID=A0AAV4P298_CAEEX|nr:hypothetical protein CEXT_755521 [Caerostris extrusa]
MPGDATDRMLEVPTLPLDPLMWNSPVSFSAADNGFRGNCPPLLASIEQKKKKEHTKRKEGSVSHSECQATRLIGCWRFPLYALIPLCGKPRVFSRRQWVPRKLFPPLASSIEQKKKKKKEHTKRKEGSVSHSGGWE